MIAIAGAALAVAGLAESFGEISPYLMAGIGPDQRFAAMIEGRYRPGDSRWSKDLFLADCLDLPHSIFALVQPPSRQEAFAHRCQEVARAAAAEMPTYSAAWLVVAGSAATLGDPAALRSALITSADTAPAVHWLAERRSALAATHIDLLDEAARTAYHRDLAALASSHAGLDVLAARYAHDPAQRAIITQVVEAAPVSMQQAFLDRVRQLALGNTP